MKTTVQALKELYAALGGNLADVALIERIPEMIEALNSIAVAVPAPTAEDEGKVMTVGEDGAWGAAELPTPPDPLPEVTSDDAGKVLTVSDAGAWEAAAASGGGVSFNSAYTKGTKSQAVSAPSTAGEDVSFRVNITETKPTLANADKIILNEIIISVTSSDNKKTYLSRFEIRTEYENNNTGLIGVEADVYVSGITASENVNVHYYIRGIGFKNGTW